MPASIDHIVDGFPHLKINPVLGMPTFATIDDANLQLTANTASVHSNQGKGKLGLLAFTATLAVYLNISATAFVAAINTGPTPIIPDGATGPQIARLEEEHTEATRSWKEYLAIKKALKQQLLGAFDDMYYRSLLNCHTGYAMVTTRKIFDHLYTAYVQFSPQDIANNDGQLKAYYNPLKPIDSLFD